jgi:hypothetical protein
MAVTSGIEYLRCPRCSRIGAAELFETSPFNNDFRKVSEGFEIITGTFGGEFRCTACKIPAAP